MVDGQLTLTRSSVSDQVDASQLPIDMTAVLAEIRSTETGRLMLERAQYKVATDVLLARVKMLQEQNPAAKAADA